MRIRTGTILFVLISLGSGLSGQLEAWDGFGGYSAFPFPWFGHGNHGPSAYALGNIPAPPYFALHPPVYYSQAVPRSYGSSPFACSGECQVAGRRAVASVVVNPHVRVEPRVSPRPQPPASDPAAKEKAVKEKAAKVTASPRRISNPFYAGVAAHPARAN